MNVSPGTIHLHRGHFFRKTACILKEWRDYLVPAVIDVTVKFSCVDAGETPAEMADAPVSWRDKDLSGERYYALFIWSVYVARRKRSQAFRENKSAPYIAGITNSPFGLMAPHNPFC